MFDRRETSTHDREALAPPRQIYFRHRDGEAIGPFGFTALEVLYDARIVDDDTPISPNGFEFKAIGEWPDVRLRVNEVKDLLDQGGDPWPETADIPRTSDIGEGAAARTPTRPLQAMLRQAIDKATGELILTSGEGSLKLIYKDGKIVALETTILELSLAHFLIACGASNEDSIARAEERAPDMGGDLGTALITLGVLEPHAYFEKFIAWAKKSLSTVVSHDFGSVEVHPRDVSNPPVPLGFDRLGVIIDVVRDGAERGFLNDRLVERRPCPLILSQVDGVKLEDLKLRPGELRVMNAINGVKTLGELIDTLGGSEQKSLDVLRAVYFAIETGFAIFGEDPMVAKEVVEAARLREVFERLKRKHFFEILGVTEKNNDEETRAKYTDLAKQYHPDTLRPGAAPELIEARREIFALVSEAFDALQSEKQRYEYANDLAEGRAGSTDDLVKVQSKLQAETLFKKAEILAKVKKYEEALTYINEAIALDPEDTEFKIYRTYYGFQQAQRSGAQADAAESAIRTILGLMKSDSNIASGYFFLAQLHKVVGKVDVATRYFEKVLEYDERNPDALREIRLAAMRQDKKNKKKWF